MKPLPYRPEEVFVFVGDGLGVPGLPHRITLARALALNLSELLRAAIDNGNYAVEKTATSEITGSDTAPARKRSENKEPDK